MTFDLPEPAAFQILISYKRLQAHLAFLTYLPSVNYLSFSVPIGDSINNLEILLD